MTGDGPEIMRMLKVIIAAECDRMTMHGVIATPKADPKSAAVFVYPHLAVTAIALRTIERLAGKAESELSPMPEPPEPAQPPGLRAGEVVIETRGRK